MGTYDDWKTRSDRDDGPELEWPEVETMIEAEYAVYEAEQAFNVLVEHWGATRAKQMMFAIFLKHGVDDLKQRRARLTPEQAEELNKMVGKLK